MEGFETPKKIFTWVSIYPEADGTSRLEKMAHIAFGFVVFLSNLCGSLAHWGYLFKFISIDLKGSVFAFMGVTVFSCLTYIIITVFRLRNQICSIIDKLTDIYQSRKYFTDTFSIFIFNVNQTEFWLYFFQFVFWIWRKTQRFGSTFVSCKRYKRMAVGILFQAIFTGHGYQHFWSINAVYTDFLVHSRRI